MFLEMDLIFFNDVLYCNLYCKYCPSRVWGREEGSWFVFNTVRVRGGALHLFMMSYYRVSSQSTHTHTQWTHTLDSCCFAEVGRIYLIGKACLNSKEWAEPADIPSDCIASVNSTVLAENSFKVSFLRKRFGGFQAATSEGDSLEWGLGAAETKTLKLRQKHTDKVP